MKKILLMSYHFPPSSSVGGIRIEAMAKFFAKFGFDVFVLTVNKNNMDPSSEIKINNSYKYKVIRVKEYPTSIGLMLKIKRQIFDYLKINRGNSDTSYSNVQNLENNNHSNNFVGKLKEQILSTFFLLPDLQRGWIVPSFLMATKIIRENKIDYFLTSGPPASVWISGLLAKIFSRTFWISDFRDPWMTPFTKALYYSSKLSNAIERWLERKIIEKSDIVLTTTSNFRSFLSKEFIYLNENKFVHLSNGFDPELFQNLNNAGKYNKFTIIYAGTIYLSRSPLPIFHAISELVSLKKIDKSFFQMILVGNCDYIGETKTEIIARKLNISEMVIIKEQVPYLKSLEMLKRSHIAILLATNQPYQIPAKFFDYMGAGIRILAITENGATRDILEKTETGQAFDSTDIAEIKKFILNEVVKYRQNLNNMTFPQADYNRENLIRRFCQKLPD